MTKSRAARLAIVGLVVSIAFHLITALFAGFSQLMLQMLVASVIYVGFVMGLMSGRRWVAWIAFLVLPIGLVIATFNATSMDGILATLFWGIVAADVIALLGIFGVLWRNKGAAAGAASA